MRHYFDGGQTLHGDALVQELRMTEPMVSPLEGGTGYDILITNIGHYGCDQVVLESTLRRCRRMGFI